MKELGRILAEERPSLLLVLSPHAPFAGGITFSAADSYGGDFSMFGAAVPRFSFPGAPDKGRALAQDISSRFPSYISRKENLLLDHGSLVPLSFLSAANKGEPARIILANPIGLSPSEAFALGRFLASRTDDEQWGLVASGDLSHRVTRDAPAGFSPAGARLDNQVVEAIRKNDPSKLLSLNSGEIEEAGECGLRSVLVFLGLAEKRKVRFLSYEAPFGVGYAVAFAPLHAACDLARMVIGTFFTEGEERARKEGALLSDLPEMTERYGCFVSLKKKGVLRGCIGTILPRKPSLAEEIAENALAAAFEDPRFPPLEKKELDEVSISVDILSSPEAVSDLSLLDPKKFGVIVEKSVSRGVLLPDLEGVDTVEAQLSIAARKAGIGDWRTASVRRFSVKRIREMKNP
jgi:AmmeMemoRadiSam system protein A